MKWKPFRLNLFYRLLLYFSVIILISLVFLAVSTYIKSARAMDDQVSVYMEQVVRNVNRQIDDYLKNYEVTTLPLVIDDTIRGFVENQETNVYQRYLNYQSIKMQMNEVATEHSEIEQIYLIEEETGQYILGESRRDEVPINELYQELEAKTPESGRIQVIPRAKHNNRYVITMARKVRGIESYQTKGIIAFDIDTSKLVRFWSDLNIRNDSFFMIVGKDGEIIYHPDQSLIGREISSAIKKKLENSSNYNFYEEWNGQDTFFHYNASDYTGWKVMLALPKTVLYEPILEVRTTVYIAAFVSFIIALIFTQHFIRKIVSPIRMVEGAMKNVEKEKWQLVPELDRDDEISSLVRNYNKMVGKLSSLVEQVYKAELEHQKVQLALQKRELERQKVEFQALQSQINPHFLYNTLGTINSYAIIKEIDEISEMTEALANMFRYSVQNLKVVSIADELSHVYDFLIIQQYRWQKTINFRVELDEELLKAKIVKLSLQPLVENAIGHGFERITDESIITIRGEISGDVLILYIEDNGVGIEPMRLRDLQDQLTCETDVQLKADQGIGLLNVTKRTKLLFGKDYGIQIFSELHKGTTIRMSVPYNQMGLEKNR